MTFEQYIVDASASLRAYPEWRVGQAYFNTLYDLRPDLSEQIRSTDLDPFYTNSKMPEFLEFVANHWEVAA